MRVASILCALGIAALAGCGGAGGGPRSLVPEGSAVYGEITLDPEGDQERAVEAILERFPGGEDAGRRLQAELAKGLREDGIDYERDIASWLGEEAVFFVSGVSEDDAEAALVIDTTDEGSTREGLGRIGGGRARERSYEGEEYVVRQGTAYGVIDGHAVIGTEAGLRAAVDTSKEGEETIEDSEEAQEALGRLPDDALVKAYFDGRRLLGSLGPAGAIAAPFVRAFDEPYTFSLTAEEDAVVLDSTLPSSLTGLLGPLFFGGGTEAVQELPRDAWLALGQPEVGQTLKTFLGLAGRSLGGQEQLEEQFRTETGLDLNEDVIGWMGDLAGYVRGTSVSALSGGVVIRTKDPDASRRALARFEALARREADPGVSVGLLSAPGGGDGFTITGPETPEPIHIVQRGGRVAVAYGNNAARELLAPRHTLADNPDFTGAAGRLGEGFAVANYLDVGPVLRLAESQGASSDPDYRRAKPYLEAFSRVIAGTRKDDELVVTRGRVELR